MSSRREFLATAATAAVAAPRPTQDDISLAAWSINRSFFVAKKWTNLDLPRIAREHFGIGGLEFVNQFFETPNLGYLQKLKKNLADYNVKPVLIMVDGEGDMSAKDKLERMTAAIMHRKWVDSAQFLGCHAIRCNMGGPRKDWKDEPDLVPRAAESFRNLLEYAKPANINVIIENHGGASSDPAVLVALMKLVDNPNFGTLPDFGNVNPGDNNEEVVRQLLPYAKGVSVKAAFPTDGAKPRWDLEKLLKLCKDAGYHGFWGIESSYGARSDDPETIWNNEVKGVQLTKAAIERVIFNKT